MRASFMGADYSGRRDRRPSSGAEMFLLAGINDRYELDHALGSWFAAFSSREPVSTSLENAHSNSVICEGCGPGRAKRCRREKSIRSVSAGCRAAKTSRAFWREPMKRSSHQIS